MRKSDDFAAKLSENASVLSVWQSFIEHPGWKLLEKALTEQRWTRLQVLADPLSGMGAIFAQEFMKGEASGVFLAMKFPEVQIEMLKLDGKRLEIAQQMEESNAKVAADVSRDRVDNPRDWFGGEQPERTE